MRTTFNVSVNMAGLARFMSERDKSHFGQKSHPGKPGQSDSCYQPLRACLQGGRVTLVLGLRRVTLARGLPKNTRTFPFFGETCLKGRRVTLALE